MYQFRSSRTQMIEVVLAATAAGQQNVQTPIPQQPNLQSIYPNRVVYVQAIEAFSIDTISRSPLSPAVPAAAADILNAELVLNVNGEDAYKQIALSSMCRISTPSFTPFTRDLFLFRDPYQVDWTKSYIQTLNAPTTAPPFAYIFQVHYSYEPWPIDYPVYLLPEKEQAMFTGK